MDFAPDSSIPGHLMFRRFPQSDNYAISPEGHPNTLRIRASRTNLTGTFGSHDAALTGVNGTSFIGRRQEHTLFEFSVEVSIGPL
jgi:hypothetical protein